CALRPRPPPNRAIRSSPTRRSSDLSPLADYWMEAMLDEIKSFMELDVFDEVDREPWMKVISTRWIYTIKRTPQGTIDRFKARLVARGFTQQFGVDYWETFSPTVTACSIRTFITVCKAQDMPIHQMDVRTAFLNGDIDGVIYVQPCAPFSKPGKEIGRASCREREEH